MPNSRFALHGLAPPKFTVCALFLPLIHGLCAFFRLLLTPLSTAPSPPPSQFTVCTSRFARPRDKFDFSLESFNLGAPEFHRKIGPWWAPRLEFSMLGALRGV